MSEPVIENTNCVHCDKKTDGSALCPDCVQEHEEWSNTYQNIPSKEFRDCMGVVADLTMGKQDGLNAYILRDAVYKMQGKINSLKAELKAYKEGIDPEDCKDGKTYLMIPDNAFWYATWSERVNAWMRGDNPYHETQIIPDRLYPLPQQQQEGE